MAPKSFDHWTTWAGQVDDNSDVVALYRVRTTVFSSQQLLAVLEDAAQHLARLMKPRPFSDDELQKCVVGKPLRFLQRYRQKLQTDRL